MIFSRWTLFVKPIQFLQDTRPLASLVGGYATPVHPLTGSLRFKSTLQAQKSATARQTPTGNLQLEKPTPLRLPTRIRTPAKRRSLPRKDEWSVVGYSTAERYDLISLAENILEQGIYAPVELDEELEPICLCVTSTYKVDNGEMDLPKEIFFFEEGSTVFWNVPELERENVLRFLKPIEENSFDDLTIHEESEMMNYTSSNNGTSMLKNGTINLAKDHTAVEKYSFSNAIAASVTLGTWEATLDRIVDSIEHVSEDMKMGQSVKMSRKEVLRKTGEIYALRHVINLSSDLLDTPDFYWDREGLETLYHVTCSHLAMGKRIRVMNEKLSHCCELMDLLTTHLNDEHHTKLEWYIIILIMIEVFFEITHFIERFF